MRGTDFTINFCLFQKRRPAGNGRGGPPALARQAGAAIKGFQPGSAPMRPGGQCQRPPAKGSGMAREGREGKQ